MFKSLFLPLIAVAVFITFVGLLSQGKLNNFFPSKATELTVNTKILKINNLQIDVELAKTNIERAKGLGGRDKLGENSGMLFVFDDGSKPTFWMKDTKIALDIIWINDKKIIKIDKNVQPEIGIEDSKLIRYSAPSSINYVLEVNAGFSDKNKLEIGDSVNLIE
ncbi:hypothetical protein A2422_01330 [Candidatus Woesebacteria bacterium RIFOXYC1_FULL_31_51]|uniref:DUF192 domain-containing protein n=1 Tax=Candidatus Woesebacteria bacterium GW2011_GWC2_31_9 TaxID=1618586 RepID=A0A0G0AYB5_9BACT|nr:MAG: hypothetical protein UR17_C0001G0717 [Candidatus Woesebacteria bacterium GW2011_GWF1_31_35]KKP22672.1 MAG: hypothetical protein UR11_C0002G0052 [Candidatus Woesebacteria bacterium GW2011_GWC1_30_29]KKP25945.1 MAG: hypothetical protein UR13_C0006G0084 [Candidatus Woesebacteria bacterium GW2011_GWD1_31_12]KKP27171.1 MAG: hypothetical protein UR16_C0006G0060 [Candidatus Woesebacteria bacterium GW2011_GWB1_31_29]KKP31550.1 MAG: hypothetical protein UR21_C0008G0027 [Candidatus Woesebacteria 